MSNIPQNSSEPPREGYFLVYQNEDGQPRIEVRLEGETVWLTQQAMSLLFQVGIPTAYANSCRNTVNSSSGFFLVT